MCYRSFFIVRYTRTLGFLNSSNIGNILILSKRGKLEVQRETLTHPVPTLLFTLERLIPCQCLDCGTCSCLWPGLLAGVPSTQPSFNRVTKSIFDNLSLEISSLALCSETSSSGATASSHPALLPHLCWDLHSSLTPAPLLPRACGQTARGLVGRPHLKPSLPPGSPHAPSRFSSNSALVFRSSFSVASFCELVPCSAS